MHACGVRPRVTVDPESGYAYIHLAEPHVGMVEQSVPLQEIDGEPDAVESIVLDFDGAGRLVGIEVTGPADRVLRSELLADADRP